MASRKWPRWKTRRPFSLSPRSRWAGFRGLVANALWIRANDLQQDDKVFEAVQLADWITKLEPHFVQVWIYQAWNMAYNISVKFKSPQDRWRWFERGISLLRDEGLRYNPDETLLYRELSWFFQHKMGQNLDDAHWTYKSEWFHENEHLARSQTELRIAFKSENGGRKSSASHPARKIQNGSANHEGTGRALWSTEWRLPDSMRFIGRMSAGAGRKRKTRNVCNGRFTRRCRFSFRRGAVFENKIDGTLHPRAKLYNIQHVNEAYEELMKSPDPNFRINPSRASKFPQGRRLFLYVYNHQTVRKSGSPISMKISHGIVDYMRSKASNLGTNATVSWKNMP